MPNDVNNLAGQRADRPMTISVVMATYNGAAFLAEQLASFARQTLLPDELIISDDGSRDATIEIAAAFAKSAPFPVKIFKNERNLGYAKNFISAANRSSAELIFFSDQDDIWADDKIAVIAAIAAGSPELVFSHDKSTFYVDKSEPDRPSHYQLLRDLGFPLAIAMAGCCMAVKSTFLAEWGWPPEDSTVSHDFWLALLSSGFNQRKYVDRALIQYRMHGGNTVGWTPAHKDLVRTPPSRLITNEKPTDLELLIEICIKKWNLNWTAAFLDVLKERGHQQNAALRATFITDLQKNAAWYAEQDAASRSLAPHQLWKRKRQIAQKIARRLVSPFRV